MKNSPNFVLYKLAKLIYTSFFKEAFNEIKRRKTSALFFKTRYEELFCMDDDMENDDRNMDSKNISETFGIYISKHTLMSKLIQVKFLPSRNYRVSLDRKE